MWLGFWRVAGLNSYVRSLPAAAAKKVRKTKSLLGEQVLQLRRTHHPETTKKPPPQQSPPKSPSRLRATSSDDVDNDDGVVRCSQCGGIDLIVVNGVERRLKGDVICACGYDDPDLKRYEDDLGNAVPYPNDDDLIASTSTPY